jgi:uncharacterized Rmd1/YagE family protein
MLLRTFPNLKEELTRLLQEEKSFQKISEIFTAKGYRCDRKTVSRVVKKLKIEHKRRTYSGIKNPFYQKRHSNEVRERISAIHKQNGHSKGTKNYFYGKTGKDSPNWKGGISTKRAMFYATNEWKEKRLEIFNLDNFTCLWCGFTPTKSRNSLNAHHIIPLSKNWNLALENSNLITLCITCHKSTFNKEMRLVTIFQDIVRTSRRLDEDNRNDYLQHNVE